MEKLYAYALDWKKKPVHMRNFRSSTAVVIELRFFIKMKMMRIYEIMFNVHVLASSNFFACSYLFICSSP